MGKAFEKINKSFELKKLLKKTDKLVKDFKVNIAVSVSDTLRQVSKITDEEYEKMQSNKFIGSKNEDNFFKDLSESTLDVNVRTFVIDKNNFALAFHPMVWNVLSQEEKIAACRLARLAVDGKDFKELCDYNFNVVVPVGKNYRGSLNIGAFKRQDIQGINVLMEVCNSENSNKKSFYINNSREKEINTIFDFASFEEMQYISPIKPKESDVAKMSPRIKAFYFDQIYKRKCRDAVCKSCEMIMAVLDPLRDVFPQFDNDLKEKVDSITKTNLFIMQTLGSDIKKRDEEYLRIKVAMFNDIFFGQEDKQNEVHNKLLQDYNNSEDILKSMDLERQLEESQKILDKIESNYVVLETAKKHFAEYFYPKKEKTKKPTEKITSQDIFEDTDIPVC